MNLRDLLPRVMDYLTHADLIAVPGWQIRLRRCVPAGEAVVGGLRSPIGGRRSPTLLRYTSALRGDYPYREL
ncbi:MAG: hypothetical protein KKD28_07305 [Chloroflexi bacterium]|nr:hypothetical protein [Chloroflexota bacterium]MBU1661263.1 hypothetical protein [Chloroflexota bacterium]